MTINIKEQRQLNKLIDNIKDRNYNCTQQTNDNKNNYDEKCDDFNENKKGKSTQPSSKTKKKTLICFVKSLDIPDMNF